MILACERFVRYDTKNKILKRKDDNLDFFKIKNCCALKDSDMRLKTQATDWETIFANQICDKRFCTYKSFYSIQLRVWFLEVCCLGGIITNCCLIPHNVLIYKKGGHLEYLSQSSIMRIKCIN